MTTEMTAAEFRKTKKDGRKPESLLVKAVIQYLETRYKAVAIRVNSGMTVIGEGKGKRVVRGAAKGTSDVIACLRRAEHFYSDYGIFCAFECKVKPNRATKEQEAFLESIRARGGVAGVVYSLDDVDRLVEGGVA